MDYDPSDPASILRFARKLTGKRFDDLFDDLPLEPSSARNKSASGLIAERYFGIKQNSVSEPDFPQAGVELKVVPMKRVLNEWRVKERCSITMIDWAAVESVPWERSGLFHKTRHILFVYFHWKRDVPIGQFEVQDVGLWRPDHLDDILLRNVYQHVRLRVMEGRAHEISEGDTRGVGAATKGTRGNRHPQPYSEVLAARRAFSFKPPFLLDIWNDFRSSPAPDLVDPATYTEVEQFEQQILQRLQQHIGKTVAQIAIETGFDTTTGAKDRLARLSRRLLGATGRKLPEFDKMGITVRTLRVDANMLPKEHVSFRAIDYIDLVDQEWLDSDFRSEVMHILFIVFRHAEDWKQQKLIKARFWTPSREQEEIMEREWTLARDLIAAGRVEAIPPASASEMVHVRPKGRNASDQMPLPSGRPFRRQSFWLNREFVRRTIA